MLKWQQNELTPNNKNQKYKSSTKEGKESHCWKLILKVLPTKCYKITNNCSKYIIKKIKFDAD